VDLGQREVQTHNSGNIPFHDIIYRKMVSCDFLSKRKPWFFRKWNPPPTCDVSDNTLCAPSTQETTSVVIQRYTGRYIRPRKSPSLRPVIAHTFSQNLQTIYDCKDSQMSHGMKVVSFDVDETLGSFSDLFVLWNQVRPQTTSIDALRTAFLSLARMYPEFLRPNIVASLKYIHSKIQNRQSHKIYLYTNNQCTYPEWIQLLVYYMDDLVHGNQEPTIFEKPICAFKIQNQVVEPRRTSYAKSHADFIQCTFLPKCTEICFVDDTKYEQMIHARVYYIQPPPYRHPLSSHVIRERFAEIYGRYPEDVGMKSYTMADANSMKKECEISRRLTYYIREFFYASVPSFTKKHMIRLGRFTRRKMHE